MYPKVSRRIQEGIGRQIRHELRQLGCIQKGGSITHCRKDFFIVVPPVKFRFDRIKLETKTLWVFYEEKELIGTLDIYDVQDFKIEQKASVIVIELEGYKRQVKEEETIYESIIGMFKGD